MLITTGYLESNLSLKKKLKKENMAKLDNNHIFQKVQSLFIQYYGEKSIKIPLLQRICSIEGINLDLQEISNYDRDRMNDFIPEMIYASLFSICGFNVSFIQKSKYEKRPDLKITNNLIEGFVEVKHIKSIDFEKKIVTIPFSALSQLPTDELLEEYGDFKKAEKIVRDKVFEALEQLSDYSKKNSSCNLTVAAIWDSVDEIEEIDIYSSIPSLRYEFMDLNRDINDVLLVYGSMYRLETSFHVIPLSSKLKMINWDLLRMIEEKTIEEVHGISNNILP